MPSKPVVLKDASNIDQLTRYAATAQVAFLGSPALSHGVSLSQTAIGKLIPRREGSDPEATVPRLSDNAASSMMTKKLAGPSTEFLRQLDTVILTRSSQLSSAGGLASFKARLRGVHNRHSVEGNVSPLWLPSLLKETNPDQPIIVLLQAAALLGAFEDAAGDRERVLQQNTEAIRRIVKELILIGGLPPTPFSVDALILLGSISSFAFELVQQPLEDGLRSPLGFRVWRAITAIVMAAKQQEEEGTDEIRNWVEFQLNYCEDLRAYSLYPARSLDLECAISIPSSWSLPGSDWAGAVLRRRMQNPKASLRERGTAVFGLWERACRAVPTDDGQKEQAKTEIRALLAELRDENPSRLGVSWVSKSLEENLKRNTPFVTELPNLNEPCQQVIQDCVKHLDPRVPERIHDATARLFEHAVLKNAGVHRRRAIDTLRAGGMSALVIPALAAILRHPEAEPWLRCRAVFAIGFMQERNPVVQTALFEACRNALTQVKQFRFDDSIESAMAVTELHAALSAVGDCFGDPSASAEAVRIREQLDVLLEEAIALVKQKNNPDLTHPVSRSLAYLVATTAHVYPRRSRRFLTQLVVSDDLPTRSVCQWGLARFTDDTVVVPAHNVAMKTFDEDA